MLVFINKKQVLKLELFLNLKLEKIFHPILSTLFFLHLSQFPEFSWQFLQPPDCDHIKAEPSLATSLWV